MDLVEYNAPDDYWWAPILYPGQRRIMRGSGEMKRSWKMRGGIRTHYVADWFLNSVSEIKELEDGHEGSE